MTISNGSYMDYVFQVNGESVRARPIRILESDGVYLFVDKRSSLIWIWAGKDSRLFHRYVAANWAGKIKRQKQFYNFKYEMVKEGREPEGFFEVLDEIENNNSDHIYTEQIREFKANRTLSGNLKLGSSNVYNSPISSTQSTIILSNIEKTRIKMELAELKKMQSHIKYTFTQIERKIAEIEKKLGV
ncbi:MAG: hypothetical protein ACFFBP_23430 [Promethearchaeota archaeon]